MNCNNIQSLAVDFHLQELDKTTQEAINLHLSSCDDCKAFYDFTGKSLGQIRSITISESSEDFYDGIMQKLDRNEKRFIIPKFIQIGVAAAVIFIAVFSGSYLGEYGANTIKEGYAETLTNEIMDTDMADNDMDLFKDL